jgi:hypothetical protein
MKSKYYIAAAWLGLALAGSAAKINPPHSFALYLIQEPVDDVRRILQHGTGDWAHVTLKMPPVVSAENILAYTFTNHLIALTPETFQRLRGLPSIPGTPFVAVADGERIYLGAFTTSASSIPLSVPCITVPSLDTAVPRNSVRIDLGYPGPYLNTNADRRSDERIRKALAGLGKLK